MTQFSTGNRDKTVGIYSYTSNISIVIREVKKEMTNVFDYEGKISKITKKEDEVVFECVDGMMHSMTIEDYNHAVDFAGFSPRKRSIVRGFRILNDAGEDVEYRFYFIR